MCVYSNYWWNQPPKIWSNIMSNEINYDRQLVSYYDLPTEWKTEARSNHDNFQEITYIMPEDDKNPKQHILYDLSECMRSSDSNFDGIIGVSNNSAIGVNLSPCGEACRFTYL